MLSYFYQLIFKLKHWNTAPNFPLFVIIFSAFCDNTRGIHFFHFPQKQPSHYLKASFWVFFFKKKL
jgi:hypothetical protein